jgi:agmatinase
VLEALSATARRRHDTADGTVWDPALPLLAQRPDTRPTGGPT